MKKNQQVMGGPSLPAGQRACLAQGLSSPLPSDIGHQDRQTKVEGDGTIKEQWQPGVVAHTCHTSTREAGERDVA